MKKHRRYEQGLTLIELIMIIVITGIAIVPISNMILQGIRGTVDSNIAAIAPSLAREKMEETKQLSFSSVSSSSGAFPSPFSDYKYTITVENVDENFKSNPKKQTFYKKIGVTVAHSSGNSFTLTTVMADHN